MKILVLTEQFMNENPEWFRKENAMQPVIQNSYATILVFIPQENDSNIFV